MRELTFPSHRQRFPEDQRTTSTPSDEHQSAVHILREKFYLDIQIHLSVPNSLQQQSE